MKDAVELNPGEVLINMPVPKTGKLTFEELGLSDEELNLPDGNLRLVFDFEGFKEHEYYHTPTIEISYLQDVTETQWICEFNETTLIDTLDHYGHATVILLDRDVIRKAEHHHTNKLIVHADFPEPVTLSAKDSYINIFK